jgi:hypothetical protein
MVILVIGHFGHWSLVILVIGYFYASIFALKKTRIPTSKEVGF